MSPHSVTCHPTQVNTPRQPQPEAGTRFTYPRGMEGWVYLGYCWLMLCCRHNRYGIVILPHIFRHCASLFCMYGVRR